MEFLRTKILHVSRHYWSLKVKRRITKKKNTGIYSLTDFQIFVITDFPEDCWADADDDSEPNKFFDAFGEFAESHNLAYGGGCGSVWHLGVYKYRPKTPRSTKRTKSISSTEEDRKVIQEWFERNSNHITSYLIAPLTNWEEEDWAYTSETGLEWVGEGFVTGGEPIPDEQHPVYTDGFRRGRASRHRKEPRPEMPKPHEHPLYWRGRLDGWIEQNEKIKKRSESTNEQND